jgi:hypothetical protein
MNKRTNIWAVEVDNNKLSEAVQRIAFTYGYLWSSKKELEIRNTYFKYIYFNPTTKRICLKPNDLPMDDYVCKVVSTFVEIMDNLEFPPVVSKEVAELKLPVVVFTYKSPTYTFKTRKVKVVSMEDGFLKGYDMEDGEMYKQFRLDRIDGPIRFIGFVH